MSASFTMNTSNCPLCTCALYLYKTSRTDSICLGRRGNMREIYTSAFVEDTKFLKCRITSHCSEPEQATCPFKQFANVTDDG